MDKAVLLLHTEPKDHNGQDLEAIVDELGMDEGQVYFSTTKLPAKDLSNFYSLADCTINISDAEGFGLGTLESLACETPIIVNMTGGLQEQVTDGEEWFGFGIEPCAKAVIGSQDVPYIDEDRISKEDFISAMKSFIELSPQERSEMGKKGRNHVLKNYSMAQYAGLWYQTFQEVFDECGSWSERKNYKNWNIEEL